MFDILGSKITFLPIFFIHLLHSCRHKVKNIYFSFDFLLSLQMKGKRSVLFSFLFSSPYFQTYIRELPFFSSFSFCFFSISFLFIFSHLQLNKDGERRVTSHVLCVCGGGGGGELESREFKRVKKIVEKLEK